MTGANGSPALPVVFLPGASGSGTSLRPLAARLGGAMDSILVEYPGLGDAPADPAVLRIFRFAGR